MPPFLASPDVLAALLGAVGGAVLGQWLSPVVALFQPYPDPPEQARPDEVPEEAAVLPPTCPHCARTVPWPRWTPLPPLLLRGRRCPHCARPLPRHAAVPLLLAVAGAALAVRFGPGAELPAFAFCAAVVVLLAVIDARTHRLPDPILKPSYPPAAALLGLAALWAGTGPLVGAVAAMAGLFTLYALLVLVSPRAMGRGDVKLSGLLGLFLGWLGLLPTLVALWSWTLLAAVYGVCHAVLRWLWRDRDLPVHEALRRARTATLPLGPFMMVTSLAVIGSGELPARLVHLLLG